MLLTRQRVSQTGASVYSERSSIGGLFGPTVACGYNETPFDLGKDQTECFSNQIEESKHDFLQINLPKRMPVKLLIKASNSDLEELTSSSQKFSNLMDALESIDLPVKQRRLRSKKNS